MAFFRVLVGKVFVGQGELSAWCSFSLLEWKVNSSGTGLCGVCFPLLVCLVAVHSFTATVHKIVGLLGGQRISSQRDGGTEYLFPY